MPSPVGIPGSAAPSPHGRTGGRQPAGNRQGVAEPRAIPTVGGMDAKLRDELGRAWCLTLLGEFRALRSRDPSLAALREPNIAVSAGFQRTLGTWRPDTRTITLSERLLDTASYREIRDVFLHEVAHQIVTELFGEPDARSHGEAFRRASARIGTPARSTCDPPVAGAGTDRGILARIRKLLALGASPNPHEAEQALTKAHELALRHNLELVDRPVSGDRYDMRLLVPLYRRVPSYLWSILSIVSDFYFTRYICHPQSGPDGKRYQCFELYGTRENLDLAEYVYYFLRNQGEVAWRVYPRKGRTSNARRAKLSFLEGMYEGFRESLERRRDQLARTRALVWRGDPGLDGFYRERNPDVSHRSVASAIDPGAHAAGVEEGRKLRIHPGIPNASKGPRRLLPDGR